MLKQSPHDGRASPSPKILQGVQIMKVKAYIHSLKDHKHNRHVLGEAEIIEQIGDNLYLAEVNGVRCTAIFNFFTGAYYVDDVYGVQEVTHA